MNTHSVILYILMVVYSHGEVHSQTFPTFQACDQVRREMIHLAHTAESNPSVKCIPQQVTRRVDDDHDRHERDEW